MRKIELRDGIPGALKGDGQKRREGQGHRMGKRER